MTLKEKFLMVKLSLIDLSLFMLNRRGRILHTSIYNYAKMEVPSPIFVYFMKFYSFDMIHT